MHQVVASVWKKCGTEYFKLNVQAIFFAFQEGAIMAVVLTKLHFQRPFIPAPHGLIFNLDAH